MNVNRRREIWQILIGVLVIKIHLVVIGEKTHRPRNGFMNLFSNPSSRKTRSQGYVRESESWRGTYYYSKKRFWSESLMLLALKMIGLIRPMAKGKISC